MISTTNTSRGKTLLSISLLCAGLSSGFAAGLDSPYVGRWALTTPQGAAGWLGITATNGYYEGSIMWGTGSVEPVDSVFITDDTLYVIRLRKVQRKDASGKVVNTQTFPDAIMGKLDGESVEEILDQTEGQGIAAQAKAIAEAIERDKELQLPARHAVGGIITPQ